MLPAVEIRLVALMMLAGDGVRIGVIENVLGFAAHLQVMALVDVEDAEEARVNTPPARTNDGIELRVSVANLACRHGGVCVDIDQCRRL